MSMFDSIINEAESKYNLGGKGGTLLSALLALMTDRNQGGFAGFLEKFNVAGLGNTVSSWINSGANTPVSNEQIESALSEPTLRNIAEKTGTDYDSATSATAFMTPHVIDALTPNGVIPQDSDLLTRIGGYLTGIGGAAAVAHDNVRAFGDRAGNTLETADDQNEGSSALKWLVPLILLGVLIALGYTFCGKSTVPMVAPTNTNANLNANKTAVVVNNGNTAKTTDSSFSIKAENGKYVVTGIVADEAARKQIVDALTAQYGAANVNFDGLKVEAGARAFGANWWENFSKMLPSLKDWKTGELSFVGNAVTVANGLPQAAIDQLKSLFAVGWKLPVSIAGAEAAAKQANEQALAELTSAGTTAEIVKALNLSIINFASGSSAIPADAKPIIDKAAEVLKKQPDGAVVEIGGHTDSDGNDDANLKLSQARADSVKKSLVALGVKDAMLAAKGYGETVPVAANDTSDNKFKNRRIEYKTADGSSPTAVTTNNINTAN